MVPFSARKSRQRKPHKEKHKLQLHNNLYAERLEQEPLRYLEVVI